MLPLVAAYFDSKVVVYLPFAMTILAFLASVSTTPEGATKVRIAPAVLAMLLFLAFHGIVTSPTIGHGSLGSIGLVITTVIYIQMFAFDASSSHPDKFIRQLYIIYSVHLAYVYVELALRLAGYESILLSLFGASQTVTKLKDYNSAVFLWYLGLPTTFFGLNGLLLGSQSAGQVMGCFLVVSAPWYKYKPISMGPLKVFFGLILFASLATINMTVAITFACVFVMMLFIVPLSALRRPSIQLASVICLVLFNANILRLLFFRIVDVERDTEEYRTQLLAPVENLEELNPLQLAFGLGRTDVVSEYSDFGIGMLVHQVGIPFVGILACALIVILVNALTETRMVMTLKRRLTQTEQKWLWLVTVNGLISFIFAMGLCHYTPSIELGGLQMFSFSLALTVVATRMLRTVRYAG